MPWVFEDDKNLVSRTTKATGAFAISKRRVGTFFVPTRTHNDCARDHPLQRSALLGLSCTAGGHKERAHVTAAPGVGGSFFS